MKCRSSPEGRFIEDMGYPSGSETAKAIRNHQLIKWSVLPTSRSASGVRRAGGILQVLLRAGAVFQQLLQYAYLWLKGREIFVGVIWKLVTPEKTVVCGFSCKVFGLQVSIGVAVCKVGLKGVGYEDVEF